MPTVTENHERNELEICRHSIVARRFFTVIARSKRQAMKCDGIPRYGSPFNDESEDLVSWTPIVSRLDAGKFMVEVPYFQINA